jgi:hypothetical protein
MAIGLALGAIVTGVALNAQPSEMPAFTRFAFDQPNSRPVQTGPRAPAPRVRVVVNWLDEWRRE